jgi:hypothetical protein
VGWTLVEGQKYDAQQASAAGPKPAR